MNWLKKAWDKINKAFGKKDTGNSKSKCPLAETGLLVLVETEDSTNTIGEPIEGAIVDISGKSPFSKKTDKEGVAGFKPIEPDTYRIKVKLTPPLSDDYEQPEDEGEAVPLGECPAHIVRVVPLVNLKVKVVLRGKDKQGQPQETPLDGVKIHIKGKDTKDETTPKNATGWASFKKIRAGEYRISVTSLGNHTQKYKPPGAVTAAIAPGETEREVILQVRPHGKLQIVLFDRKDKPISGKAWELLSPIRATGKTGSDGLIKVEDLNIERTAGVLRVDMGAPAQPKPVPAPVPVPAPSAPPPHPPSIKPEDFKDENPAPKKPDAKEGIVEWSLKIGLLEDYDNENGVKSRLHNLGFGCDTSSDKATTTRAVKAYQKHYQKQNCGSGNISDIKGHIYARHDNPGVTP